MNSGGALAKFAKKHQIPRTTLIGWRDTDGADRYIKLYPFNESKIMELLFASPDLQNWSSVKEAVHLQSGENLSRRSICRLLQRWGLNIQEKIPAGVVTVRAKNWRQPPETQHLEIRPVEGVLWQLISGRGVEGFMLTGSKSAGDLERVAAGVVKKLKGRWRKLRTNDERFAEVLGSKLPNYVISSFKCQ